MKIKLFTILAIGFYKINSQNLIINGGFEEFTKCPDDVNQIERSVGWKSKNKGTPDYFNTCSKNKNVSVPNNYIGSSSAYAGNAYVGFGYFYKENHLEIIQTHLRANLLKDHYYCLTFYLKRPAKYKASFNELSIFLSDGEQAISTTDFYTKEQILNNNFRILQIEDLRSTDWFKINAFLKAKSNEQFLAIGVNKPENAVKMSIQARTQGSYYYIDNISLVEVNDSSECSDKKDIKNIASLPEKNALDSAKVKPIILRDVFFEADKSELLPSSFKELDNLFSYLRTNKASKIEISGHTDNSGKEDHNLKLSKDRATAVSKYLIDKGIEATRISTKGYGSSKPIKPNTSEENRAINRRVEFRILT